MREFKFFHQLTNVCCSVLIVPFYCLYFWCLDILGPANPRESEPPRVFPFLQIINDSPAKPPFICKSTNLEISISIASFVRLSQFWSTGQPSHLCESVWYLGCYIHLGALDKLHFCCLLSFTEANLCLFCGVVRVCSVWTRGHMSWAISQMTNDVHLPTNITIICIFLFWSVCSNLFGVRGCA